MSPPPTDVVALAQALIRIPSVNPDGDLGSIHTDEEGCARFVTDFLTASGAEVQLDFVEPRRPM